MTSPFCVIVKLHVDVDVTFDLCRLWTQSGEPGVGGGVQDHQPLLQQYRSLLQHLRRLQVQQQQQQQQQLQLQAKKQQQQL